MPSTSSTSKLGTPPIAAFTSTDGGPFVLQGCFVTTAVQVVSQLGGSRQSRVAWRDACGGNVIQNFDSAVAFPCSPPPGAPVDGGAAPGGTTITVTHEDGSTETITIP